jgi:hypothetical protein
MNTLIRPVFSKSVSAKEAFQKIYKVIDNNAFNTFIVDVDKLGINDGYKCQDYCRVLTKNAEKNFNSIIFNTNSPSSYKNYQELMKRLLNHNENNLVVYKTYLGCLNHSPAMYHRDLIFANNNGLHFGSYIKLGNHLNFKNTQYEILTNRIFRDQNINEMKRIHNNSNIKKSKNMILDKSINLNQQTKMELDSNDKTILIVNPIAEVINLLC